MTQGACFFILEGSAKHHMKALQERISKEGLILSDTVLKVDSFLNHQVDTQLALAIGREFGRLFGNEPVTKVLTIEASGIQFAMATGIALNVPFIYAKKKKAITLSEDVYTAPVHSFTRQETYQISVSSKYLRPEDKVLIIDDFLATGAALVGLVDIVKESGAQLAGVGCVIEKSFQEGRSLLEKKGVRVHSLARIASMSPGEIHFIEDDSVVHQA
ncbi:Xanthine phosphoribosyltransferase [compost metagenome]